MEICNCKYKGGWKLWRDIWREGLNTCDKMWQGEGGGRFLPKIAWHHLWTASYGLYTKNIRYTKWQVLKGSIFNAVAKSVCNPVILPASMPCTTCCFFCFYWPAFRRVCVNTLTMDFTSAHKQINLIKLIILKQTRRKQTLTEKSLAK